MMKPFQKYILMFVGESILFVAVLLLIDWISETLSAWYNYAFQGLLFGLFMTLYASWSDKNKKKKEETTEE